MDDTVCVWTQTFSFCWLVEKGTYIPVVSEVYIQNS